MKNYIYFTGNYSTLEELKKEYRKLALQNHPDTGGSLEAMKQINAEYEKLFNIVQQQEKANTKKTYNSTSQPAPEETPDIFINIINELIKYKNINIELIGSWIWIDGNTYPIKDLLHKLNFEWSKSRKKWYFTTTPKANTRYKKSNFDVIRYRYGSRIFQNNNSDANMLPA